MRMTLWRSAAFSAWFYGVTVAFCVASPLVRLGAWLRPRRYHRAAILGFARAWARAILGGLRRLCRIDARLVGDIHLPPAGQAFILAAQHQSTFETLFWLVRLADPVFVVKRELFAVPLFGAMLREAGMIPVDRGAGASALRAMLRAARAAAAEGRPIVIFPEGTRSPPGTIGTLRAGVAMLAERTGLPIVPVRTDSGRFWGRLAFRKNPGTIRIVVAPNLPRDASRETIMRLLYDTFASAEPVDNSVGRLSAALSRGRRQPS